MAQKKIALKKNKQPSHLQDNTVSFKDKLGLDDRDTTILTMVQKNPNISQEEIAKKIHLSQPSVGARIRKLKQNGVLETINGMNFKVVDLKLAKVDINATDTVGIIEEFRHCPFFINALITSGKYNLCIFFTATDLKRLEGIVNHHLRKNEMVKDIELNIVIGTAKDFVLPMNLEDETTQDKRCDRKCEEILLY
jgi:Lrp/AsnC family transcriptional regulator, leucine-responsive regulatory protein